MQVVKTLLCISIILISVAITAAQTPSDEERLQREVREIELARFDAQVKGDINKLKLFFADELKYTHATGKTETKDEFLKALSAGLKYLSIEPSQLEVHVYGQSAVITGQATIKVESAGQQLSFKIKYTDVYVLRDKRWQVVAWQSTRLPE